MDFSQLMALASGHADARILQAAVSLGIFEPLATAPQSGAAVARRLDLDPDATELLLNGLAALDVLEKRPEGFLLTEAAKKYLLPSSPQYSGGMILFEDLSWQYWARLPQAIRTGRPVRSANMYQDDARETAIFIDAMDSLVKARGDAQVLTHALDWRDVGELLDIGSGPATYPIALCRAFPKLRVTIIDLPGTLKITERYVREAGMAGRMTLIPGDYRSDAIPGLFDAVFLSNIIHGENCAKNQTLIGKLADNLKPSGRLIIKDHILDESRASPAVGAIFSLLMLLTTDGGRCYSFGEIRGWMEHAGLSRVQQIDLPPPLTSSLVIGAR